MKRWQFRLRSTWNKMITRFPFLPTMHNSKKLFLQENPASLSLTVQPGEGYEFIRRIKADDDLWVIPVLVLTTASTMEALLQALESNADNFIAPPYNSPDHLSLIEGMLATPVERPTPEEIKKQFRVRQDDQTYVVAATSRKLLEYLLSSFEIVAGKSSELSSVTSKLEKLSESARDLEQTVTGQTRDIEVLKATVSAKRTKNYRIVPGV